MVKGGNWEVVEKEVYCSHMEEVKFVFFLWLVQQFSKTTTLTNDLLVLEASREVKGGGGCV